MRTLIEGAMWRTIPIGSLADDESFHAWLSNTHEFEVALAHADDGVIWGRRDPDGWIWSSTTASVFPSLKFATIQQLRLFSSSREAFLWRTKEGLAGRVIEDDVGSRIDYFDESFLLWGTGNDGPERAGFQARVHGAEGLCHAPPTEIAARNSIVVRSYVSYGDDGGAFVTASRLVA